MTRSLLACAIVRSRSSQRSELRESVVGQSVTYVDDTVLAVARIADPSGKGIGYTAQVEEYLQILFALHHREAILPLKMGSFPQEDAAILELLRTHSTPWLRSLEQVDGCDEMGIELTLDEFDRSVKASGICAPARAHRSGKEYLFCRRAELTGADARRLDRDRVAARWQGALSGHYRACRIDTAKQAGSGPVSLAFLVARDRREEFRRLVRRLAALVPENTRLSGPWPPFSFVGY